MTHRGFSVRRVAAALRGMVLCAVLALVCAVASGVAVDDARAGQEPGGAPGQAGMPVLRAAGDAAVSTNDVAAPVDDAAAWAAGPATGADATRVLRIGFSTSSPPYVDMVNKAGLEPVLAAAALARSGYRIVPVFLPHARALELVRKGTLDGCGPVGRHTDVAGLAVGDMYLRYSNVVASLEAAGLDIRSLADLRELAVTAFHNARVFMGPEFAAMADANPRYEELVDQRAQVEAFFYRRDRVIVADERILAFHRARLAARGVAVPVRIHRIFPPQDRFFAFRDPAVRDAFNTGLRALRESGEYARITQQAWPHGGPGDYRQRDEKDRTQ
jgi:polar amino acid transport system substrate-binding protein